MEIVKVLIDNGADVNGKDEVSSDSFLFFWLVCFVKVCIGWKDSTNVDMPLWQCGHCEDINW